MVASPTNPITPDSSWNRTGVGLIERPKVAPIAQYIHFDVIVLQPSLHESANESFPTGPCGRLCCLARELPDFCE